MVIAGADHIAAQAQIFQVVFANTLFHRVDHFADDTGIGMAVCCKKQVMGVFKTTRNRFLRRKHRHGYQTQDDDRRQQERQHSFHRFHMPSSLKFFKFSYDMHRLFYLWV